MSEPLNNGHSSPFRYSEARFALVVGLSRGDAKALREAVLEKGLHWRREHGEIALTLRGVTRLWKQLRTKPETLLLSECLLQDATEKKAIATLRHDTPRLVRVWQLPLNPFIIKARDESGLDYTVRVARNGVFSVGLEVEVVPDTQPGLWRVLGPIPRWSGDRAYKPSVLEKKTVVSS